MTGIMTELVFGDHGPHHRKQRAGNLRTAHPQDKFVT